MTAMMSCEKLGIWEYLQVAPFVVVLGLGLVVEPGLTLGIGLGLGLTESGNVVSFLSTSRMGPSPGV